MAGTGKMGMSRKRLDKAKGVTKAVAKYGTVPGLTYTGAKKIKGMSKHEGPRGPRPLPKAVQATPSGQPNAPKRTKKPKGLSFSRTGDNRGIRSVKGLPRQFSRPTQAPIRQRQQRQQRQQPMRTRQGM